MAVEWNVDVGAIIFILVSIFQRWVVVERCENIGGIILARFTHETFMM